MAAECCPVTCKFPFYAATCLPRESRQGRPGLKEIISIIRETWETRRDEIEKSADSIEAALKVGKSVSSSEGISAERIKSLAEEAYSLFRGSFDQDNGGFGRAPKFPMVPILFFHLRKIVKRVNLSKRPEFIKPSMESLRFTFAGRTIVRNSSTIRKSSIFYLTD